MDGALSLVKFPERDIRDVPRTLRALADAIEKGKFGEAYHVAYVVDEGDGEISVGLCGKEDAARGSTAHFLFCLGQRKLEQILK